ncbi:hypothetical protein Scep_013624 [Stephania cephalantha]|uniref:RCC1-like domain-containing protein n=1 Tax=Stephania cephalantha TaxID=152367 RepID=A0AAP0PAY3_9MAGN
MLGVIVRRGKASGGGRQWQLWHYCHSITTKAYSQNCLRGGGGGGGGAVMSFGDGSHGALGLPSSSFGLGTDAYEPTLVPAVPPIITTIAAGHYHSLAVTAEGHVWAWGRNREFQLGRSPSSNSGSDSWNEPGKVQGLDQVRVSGVSASGVVSAAIGDDGSLWVWGKSKRGQLGLGRGVIESPLPSRVDSLAGEHIVKVSFGWGHALACTKDGKLFGWGYSADGRLGRINGGTASYYSTRDPSSSSSLDVAERAVLEQMEKENFMPTVWEPTLVQESHGFQVSDIACGHDHSLVLFSGGRLISGGSNQNGQLGRRQVTPPPPPPYLVDMLQVEMSALPLSISAGLGHSFAVKGLEGETPLSVSGGRAVYWGGECPSSPARQKQENVRVSVSVVEDVYLTSVDGRSFHTLVLPEGGRLISSGCARAKRCALCSGRDYPTPCSLDDSDITIFEGVCGHDHFAARRCSGRYHRIGIRFPYYP